MDNGYENALLLVIKAIDKIMLGGEENITQEDLVVSKLLGQDIIRQIHYHLDVVNCRS